MNIRPGALARACWSLALVSLLIGCGSQSHSTGLPPQPSTLPSSTPSSSATADGWLNGISAPAASAAWAVGNSCGPGCGIGATSPGQTLILHWNGTAWSQTPGPSPGGQAILNGVSTGPGGTAWAAGEACASDCNTASQISRTFILRWNGSTWSQTPSPSPAGGAELFDVSAGPGGTAWAVGDYCVSDCDATAPPTRPLILRWNGSSWSQTFKADIDAELIGVSTGPDGTAWAVGVTCAPSCYSTTGSARPLIVRWNGSTWSQTPSPSLGQVTVLSAVTVAPDGTAWAAGNYCRSGCDTSKEHARTLILHWNGSAWSQTPSPSPGQAALNGVSTGPGGIAWAVGHFCPTACLDKTTQTDKSLILRWNGRAWSQTPSPSPARITAISAVAAAPDGSAWAVGVICQTGCGTSSQQNMTLILRWNGRIWAASP